MRKGTKHTEETKRKMSINHADYRGEKNPCFGRSLSKETIEKLRQAKTRWYQNNLHPRGMLGKRHGEETREKMRVSHLGKSQGHGWKLSEKTKQKISNANKGVMFTKEHKAKIANANKGNTNWLGRQHTEKTKKKMSEVQWGERNHQWLGGISFEPYTPEFNEGLKHEIRERDNHQCQFCGTRENGRKLPVHHIDYNKKNSKKFNLIALCDPCNLRANKDRPKWQFLFEVIQELRL